MTAPTGVGRGGPRPGSGRPVGSVSNKARALIIEAERNGLLTPVEYLLGLMRDETQPTAARTAAAIAVAPYLHPRLSMFRVAASNERLSDEQLVAQVAQFEEIVAAMPERDHVTALKDKLEDTLEEVQQLSQSGRETFFRKMVEDGEAGLRRLNEPPPGAVLRRPSDDRLHQPAPASQDPRVPSDPPIWNDGAQPAPPPVIRQPGDHPQPAPVEGRRLMYDPAQRKMVSRAS